jgi:hypothetical protein
MERIIRQGHFLFVLFRKSNGTRWARHVGRLYGDMRNEYEILAQKSERNRKIKRPTCKRENNILMYLKTL